ncbi:50S ribosomal protein L25 [Paenibacillus dendritiformis]|uniref:Large ribosomal subunit protein bL25 n=1 Tax=Paenibacillus dendritiformis C454 TaxID=1131935 RepID=H3SD24_9BACL|nr:50S ribosomal protein L25 [Paenibacillus dendritiformis]EHQ63098.1 50S ribosomal protein L25 [Paenibacillus dendritiformis C454]CAH8770951.1 50S ribosomal protein L25 [Paenibacillus dendritiformis]
MSAHGNTSQLTAERRTDFNRSSIRSLRKSGRIPAVVYGPSMEGVPIHLDAKEVYKFVRTSRSELFHLKVEDKTIPAVIKAVQERWGNWIHLDIQQVSENKPLRVKIALDYQGVAAGTKVGGVLQTQEVELEVEGLPSALPTSIPVDISHLNVGDKLTASELKLPAGIQLAGTGSELLASIILPRGATAAETEEETAESAAK